MATLETAKAKYAAKSSIMAARWVAAKSRMKSDWANGLAAFGVTVGPTHLRAYQEGIDRVTESQFSSAVTGKADKWAKNFVAAMSS